MTQRSWLGGGASLVSKKVQNRCHVSGHVLRPILLMESTKICRICTTTQLKPYISMFDSYKIIYLHVKS